MSLQFKYGDYVFSPRPLFSISSSPLKSPSGLGYGIIHTISLDGDLIITESQQPESGIIQLFEEMELLKSGLDHDGKLLLVTCNDSGILSGYPKINSYNINPESDNYTRRISYDVEFEMPTYVKGADGDVFNTSIFPPYIESCDESWDIEIKDERLPLEWSLMSGGTGAAYTEALNYQLAVTHTVDVTARLVYTGDRTPSNPWQDAQSYAAEKLGFQGRYVNLSGIMPLPGAQVGGVDGATGVFNNYRQVSLNPDAGTIQVTETFIVAGSGGDNQLPPNSIETFEISTTQEEGIVSVSIQGEIQGLATIDWGRYQPEIGFDVTTSKYEAATQYWSLVQNRLFDRAVAGYEGITGECYNRPLNPNIEQRTVGVNPIEGTVTYEYTYTTKPSGCITGDCILSQNITIDDQLATDVFASQVVIGRAAGPILQDIGTVTVRTRTVNIELVTLPPTSCATVDEIYAPVPTGSIDDFISTISGDLGNNYSQVFVSQNSENWAFSQGRFTKSVGFTYNNCST